MKLVSVYTVSPQFQEAIDDAKWEPAVCNLISFNMYIHPWNTDYNPVNEHFPPCHKFSGTSSEYLFTTLPWPSPGNHQSAWVTVDYFTFSIILYAWNHIVFPLFSGFFHYHNYFHIYPHRLYKNTSLPVDE